MAYADPVYLGQHARYDHPRSKFLATLPGHKHLIARLVDEFPDGWALSLHTPSLRRILPLCPPDARVAAWVKPFCVFKVGVNPAYAWEPVIWRGGRKRGRQEATVRDWVSANVTLRRGTVGAKPPEFCRWLFELLGLGPADTLVDLYPGSRAVTRAWKLFQREALANA